MSSWYKLFKLKFDSLFRNNRKNEELRKEMEFHLSHCIEENLKDGMTEQEARKAALREFGNTEFLEEECRDSWGMRMVTESIQDLRYCWRKITNNKLISLMVVVTLMVCISANFIVLSLLNYFHFDTQISNNPEQTVRIYDSFNRPNPNNSLRTSPSFYVERKEQSELIEDIGIHNETWCNISFDEGSIRTIYRQVTSLTPSLLHVFGIQPRLGRLFVDSDAFEGGNNQVAILKHDFWKRFFDSDPNIVGKTLFIDHVQYEIVGVMPRGFQIPQKSNPQNLLITGVYRPLVISQESLNDELRSRVRMGCFARLKAGYTASDLEQELRRINENNAPKYPNFQRISERFQHKTHVTSLRQDRMRRGIDVVWYLQIGMLALLSVGCANIATLILGKNISLMGEISTCMALGASRLRMMRLFLSEVVLLILFGMLLAIPFTYVGFDLLLSNGYFDLFVNEPQFEFNAKFIAIGLVISFILALIVAVISAAPIIWRKDLRGMMQSGDQRTGSSGVMGFYKGSLLVVQIAVCVVFMILASLLFRSLHNKININPGLQVDRVFSAAIRLPNDTYTPDEKRVTVRDLYERLNRLPVVESVGVCQWIPLKFLWGEDRDLYIEGIYEPGKSETVFRCTADRIYGDIFETLNVPFIQGRGISANEAINQMPVAVIDSRIAEAHFQGQNPVGKRIAIRRNPETRELDWVNIVGVVKAMRTSSLTSEEHTPGRIYLNAQRSLPFSNGFVIRTKNAESLKQFQLMMRKTVDEIDPKLGLVWPETMIESRARHFHDHKNLMILISVLSGIVILLSISGLFVNIYHTISSRTREIGIRLALGEPSRSIIWRSMSHWFKFASGGIFVGLFVTVLVSTYVSSLLFEVSRFDLPTYLVVLLAVFGTVALAARIAAQKAVGINPSSALRTE